MLTATAQEDDFGHVALADKLAAASADIGEHNPELARELAEESEAILSFVHDEGRELELAAQRSDVVRFEEDDVEGRRFRGFRAIQKHLVPPPNDGPFAQPTSKKTDLVFGRLSAVVTRCWSSFLHRRGRELVLFRKRRMIRST